MLTTLDDLVFHVPGNGFQDYLLHHLHRDQGEVDQSVVSCILLALFEDSNEICFPSVLRHVSQSPQSLKDYREWPCNDFSQLPRHLWVHPIRVYGLIYVQFA